MPAIEAFCVSSKLARPDTMSTMPVSGSRFSFTAQPITLSTALWRPTSSRSTSIRPVRPSKRAAACSPPVFSNTAWAARSCSGKVTRTAGIDDEVVVGDGVLRTRAHGVDARLAAEPAGAGRVERPLETRMRRRDARCESHVEHVVGVEALIGGAGAVAGGGEVVAARDHALRDEEAGREVEVVARRAHGDGQRRAADADLEGLLHGEEIVADRARRSERHPGHPLARRDAVHVPCLHPRSATSADSVQIRTGR